MTIAPDVDYRQSKTNILRLLYCSRIPPAKKALDIEEEIFSIVSDSRERNCKVGITGVLVTDRTMYYQVIEGIPSVIKDLIGRICCDIRHQELKIINFQYVEKRLFREWSMAYLTINRNLDEENYFFPSTADPTTLLAISAFCTSVRHCLIENKAF